MAAIRFFKDDIRRAQAASKKRTSPMSMCGTSGGVWGLERGYCMMIGGDKAVVDRLDPIFEALAPGAGDIRQDARPRRARSARRRRLYACRAGGRGPFRQDGP